MSDDNRPRCEHLVVYPMENCATCLKAEVDRLKYELAVIGDMAVSDWNEAVVSKVDAVVPEAPPTYGERRRAELAEYQRMRTEIAELKAKLAEQKEGLELQARLILAGVRKEYELQLEVAKLKAGCNS